MDLPFFSMMAGSSGLAGAAVNSAGIMGFNDKWPIVFGLSPAGIAATLAIGRGHGLYSIATALYIMSAPLRWLFGRCPTPARPAGPGVAIEGEAPTLPGPSTTTSTRSCAARRTAIPSI